MNDKKFKRHEEPVKLVRTTGWDAEVSKRIGKMAKEVVKAEAEKLKFRKKHPELFDLGQT